jgi:thiamine biosynthesis lipoprotein
MATRFEIVLHGDDPVRLRAAGEAALREIERLDAQLSMYSADSDISQINRLAAKEPVKVEPRLFGLLQHCSELTESTCGAFDIAVAPLMRIWGFTGDSGRIPDAAEIESALQVTGMRHVRFDEDSFTVRFDREGVMLDLGAIGKGYAVEKAAETLREDGVTSALIHGGTSTVFGIGAQPDGKPWKVAVRHPTQPDEYIEIAELCDSALSVSAPHGKSFVQRCVQFGHVIDPQSGQPVQCALTAVVTGASPTDCDALSTALLVLGEAGLPLLAERFPGYSGAVAVSSADGVRTAKTT